LTSRRLIPVAALVVVLSAAAVFAQASPARQNGASLSGAGSTFVYPLISAWTQAYKGAKINYSPIGSGGGIAAITSRAVDFGASDAPLSGDQFAAAKGVVQIPWALSATSVPYNVKGVSYGLKLSGHVLADIFLGKIKKWNDKQIAKLNVGVKLPGTKITPVYRSDASGTTFNFTDYLSRVSSDWKSKVGRGTQVRFPTGEGGKGSSGVSGVLSRTDGAITYVDVAYSLKNHFTIAKIQNRAGRFQLPGLRGIKAAEATITKVPSNGFLSVVNPPKSQKLAYPICTFTYAIVPLKTKKAKDLQSFLSWAVTKGQGYGTKLLFQPLPKVVVAYNQKTIKRLHS
jgi:phosphate transport system substrate-binding protein